MQKAGAPVVVVTPYYNKPTRKLIQHYKAIADSTRFRSAYNVPAGRLQIEPATWPARGDQNTCGEEASAT